MLGRLRYSVLVLSALEESWRVRDVAMAYLTVSHRLCVQMTGDPENGGFGGDCIHQTSPLYYARSHVGFSSSLYGKPVMELGLSNCFDQSLLP